MLTPEELSNIVAREKDSLATGNTLGLDILDLLAHVREQEEQIKSLEYIILQLKAEIYDSNRASMGGKNAIHNA